MGRVLFVDQFADMGGGQRILLDLVRHFRGKGAQVGVAIPDHGALNRIFEDDGVETFAFELPGLTAGRKTPLDTIRYLRALPHLEKQLVRIAAGFDADLIFCNGPRATGPVVAAAGSLGLPCMCAVHLIHYGAEKAILSWCFSRRQVHAVTFCSSAAAEPFKAIAPEKKVLVGNWVSPAILSAPATHTSKEVFGMRQGDLAVGVLGRISPNKGQAMFLEALIPLLDTKPELRLLVAGGSDFEDCAEEANLKELAKGRENAVFLLGAVGNTVAFLDALDVLVVPSLWEEPFGLVAVEGMARALPVVATKSGCLKEIVIDGSTGLLVDKNASALRSAVQRLLDDPLLREEFGEEGRKRAIVSYAAAPRLDAVYQVAMDAVVHGRRSSAA